MGEFLKLVSPEIARETWYRALEPRRALALENHPTSEALGRVLGHDLFAPFPLPPFTRSTVDGYAVRAQDTYGASPSLPAYLQLVAEIPMGELPRIPLQPQEAILIHTGGMLPEGADAVVMQEDTQVARPTEIEILKAVAPGENLIPVGEDVQPGEHVLSRGTFLGPQEIGGAMALGWVELEVVKKPQVAVLSTGDELIPPQNEPQPAQIRDVNSYALSSLILGAGGQPKRYGILPDNRTALSQAVADAHSTCDAVLITAGSSVSYRDITADVINQLGEPGVVVHGISIKPGKPTILAVVEGIPLIGLPGNPISALVIGQLFVVPLIHSMLGLKSQLSAGLVQATLSTNIASEAGRDDFLPVKLLPIEDDLVAEPVYGRSNLIFTLVRADGLIHIPSESTGLAKGARVNVQLFRRHP